MILEVIQQIVQAGCRVDFAYDPQIKAVQVKVSRQKNKLLKYNIAHFTDFYIEHSKCDLDENLSHELTKLYLEVKR